MLSFILDIIFQQSQANSIEMMIQIIFFFKFYFNYLILINSVAARDILDYHYYIFKKHLEIIDIFYLNSNTIYK